MGGIFGDEAAGRIFLETALHETTASLFYPSCSGLPSPSSRFCIDEALDLRHVIGRHRTNRCHNSPLLTCAVSICHIRYRRPTRHHCESYRWLPRVSSPRPRFTITHTTSSTQPIRRFARRSPAYLWP